VERQKDENTDTCEEVTFVAKRQKKELDFQLLEMETQLGYAEREAIAGNKSMMDYYLQEATKHATSAFVLDSTFYSRVSLIRRSLGSEKDFHRREMDNMIGYAKREALAGNNLLTDYYIQEATKHARSACVMDSAFYSRVSAIRRSLGSEKDFHRREMENKLGYAEKEALAGNKKLMDYHIQVATKHARLTGVLDGAFQSRTLAIHKHLGSEKHYHLREVDLKLEYAKRRADVGDKSMMAYYIKEAAKDATLAGVLNASFHEKVSGIERSLLGSEKNLHPRVMESKLKRSMKTVSSTEVQRSLFSHHAKDVDFLKDKSGGHESSDEESKVDDDEVAVKKEVAVKENPVQLVNPLLSDHKL
jgi:hypothetical protein